MTPLTECKGGERNLTPGGENKAGGGKPIEDEIAQGAPRNIGEEGEQGGASIKTQIENTYKKRHYQRDKR